MRPKPIFRRKRADQDVLDAVDLYLLEAGGPVALHFVDALASALERVSRHPAAGSPRYAHELDLPGVRHCRIKGFPYLVFYVERSDHVDVWRVLHAKRDIPEWLDDPEGA